MAGERAPTPFECPIPLHCPCFSRTMRSCVSNEPSSLLECGHVGHAFGSPMCTHIVAQDPEPTDIVRWYTGRSLDSELLCVECSSKREQGARVPTFWLCEDCYDEQVGEFNPPMRSHGHPEVFKRAEALPTDIVCETLPKVLGEIVDFAPIQAPA